MVPPENLFDGPVEVLCDHPADMRIDPRAGDAHRNLRNRASGLVGYLGQLEAFADELGPDISWLHVLRFPLF